ncbi:ArsB/NhaD family transporter [Klebsiella pneumoniae]|uniref:ArsB/NhaD family transporter n=1 Tax=Klebsiella pneumoniae TaxID=573 RepID=UPI0038906372
MAGARVSGRVLALGTGVIHISDIPVVWNIVWNATAAAFIAVIIINLLLDGVETSFNGPHCVSAGVADMAACIHLDSLARYFICCFVRQ